MMDGLQPATPVSSQEQASQPPQAGGDNPGDRPTSPSDYSPDIEQEVAQAMADMSAEDLMELSLSPSDSIEEHPYLSGGDPETRVRRAKIVGIHGDDVFLDLGGKAQGVVPKSQFSPEDPVQKGRMVEVVLQRYEPEDGLWIASRDGAVMEAHWDTLAVGSIVEGRVTGLNKGGLELNLHGIRGFMPASHVDVRHIKDISVFLNQVVQCEVLEINRRDRNVLVSRRKHMEHQNKLEKERLRKELAPGQVRQGVISNITDFGAFVDLGGGLDGLIPVRELAWGQVDKVGDVVKVGQPVEVAVLKVDAAADRISLSLRKLTSDPWATAPNKYPEGTEVKARVLRIIDVGAFAEVEPGIEALIPISEISWTERVRRPSDVLSIGQMVDTVVLRMEAENRRIALSMKRVASDPWEQVLDGYPKDSVISGKVTRLADFGAFVELAPGVEGLVHISELSTQRIKNCAEAVQEGQEIQAKVLSVDRKQRRISLSIRAVLVEAASAAGPPAAPAAASGQAKKKREKPLRGGLATNWDWQGLTLGR